MKTDNEIMVEDFVNNIVPELTRKELEERVIEYYTTILKCNTTFSMISNLIDNV